MAMFNSKSVLVLLVLVIVLEVAALQLYWRVDSIVNVDLYKYGLQFSSAWAEEYWYSYRSVLYSFELAVILVGGSLLVYHEFTQERDSFSRWGCILFRLAPAGLGAVSLYFILRVDSLVNGTLYQYGLQFSQDWALGYWEITWATLALLGVAAALSVPLAYLTWSITRVKSPDN